MPAPFERCVVITGATRGLGRAIAVQLSAPGTVVVANYASDAAAADATLAAIAERGGEGIAVRADVGTQAGVDAVFDAAAARCGCVDVVVHNAFYLCFSRPLETKAADMERAMAIGPLALMRCAQRAAPLMQGRSGRIVATSSAAPGRLFHIKHGDRYFPMAVAKGAIETTVRYLTVELGAIGATANVVAAGYMRAENFPGALGEEFAQRAARKTPLGRVPPPEEIANVVAFLASPQGGWVTGQTVLADGGFALI